MGTTFLDEINSTTLQLQVKLLRVLQERQLERVGDTQTIEVDTRILAASNRDLIELVREGLFREDVYWRLNVVPVVIPPLRERRDDIPELVTFFLNHYNEINDRYVVHIQRDVVHALQNYHWPGNVRELQNYVERAVVMATGDEFTMELLPPAVTDTSAIAEAVTSGSTAIKADLDTLANLVVQEGLASSAEEEENLHGKVVDRVEKELIEQVLKACDGVQTRAAAKLGINRNTLHKKIRDYGLE